MDKEIKQINSMFLSFMIGITILLCVSLIWNINKEYLSANEYAIIESEASYNKDVLYRRWASMHGGVYVPITETTPPNEYLKFIPDRDITTETGKKLTLVNPAYMTRQVFSIASEQYGVIGHITSLNPIRPENKADDWETAALQQFEKGELDFSSIEKINGNEYMRFMHAMKVEKSCLKCHAEQGYEVGDIRGGISVSVPMEKYNNTAKFMIRDLTIAHALLFLVILGFSFFGFKRYRSELLKRHLIQKDIKESEANLKIQNEEYIRLNKEYKLQNEELHKAKEKTEESKRLLSKIAENYPNSFISIIEKDLTVGFSSGQEFKRLNLNPDEFIGCTLEQIFAEQAPKVRAYYLDTFNGEETTFELYINDQYQLYRTVPIIEEDNKISRILTVVENITNRKLNEQELIKAKQKAEESTRRLVEAQSASKVGSWQTDLTNFTVIWSEETYRIFEMDSKTDIASHEAFMEFVHPDDRDRINDFFPKTFDTENIYHSLEHRIITLKGNLKYVEERWKISKDKDGTLRYAVGTCQDISERKIQEQQLNAAKEKAEESDRLKTEFINNMSHEIRTPMNGILGFSELLGKKDKSEEKRNNYVKIIQNSGNQLMRIIDDILEISKLGTKQVKINEKDICLNDLLLEQFSIFDIKAKENKTPLYLKKGLSDMESTIFIDDVKLNKIVSNLLENALKFTNKGFIEFGYNLNTVTEISEVEIYVKDTGVGISPNKHEIVFERFSQEEKDLSKNVGGLGLGLSIAKENAELLGGTITLKSEKGEGATFFVTIPYKPVYTEKEVSISTNDKTPEKQDEFSILIVEDEEVNYLYLETLLKDEIEIDCKMLHAKNGQDAVGMCKDNTEIDFVFMDLKMPIMNGYEATKLIKEFCPNIPIVAQTAYTTDEDKEKALAAGCDDFISKPIKEETLRGIIYKYLPKR